MALHPPRIKRALLTCTLLALFPTSAHAGMPSLTLTDLAEMRVQTISFFLLVFLLSAAAIRFLWNRLRIDFPRLPRLTYPRALAVVGLWGLVFLLVLTMISGARELMTPGAWDKVGATYQLKPGATPDDGRRAVWQAVEFNRRKRLEDLRAALWFYAGGHAGAFPPDDLAAEIPAAVWETADPSRVRFRYVPGRRPGAGSAPLAYEPDVFGGGPRLVLTADGRIVEMTNFELTATLSYATTAPAPAAGRTP